MDNFCEQLIKPNKSTKDTLYQLLIVCGTTLVSLLLIALIPAEFFGIVICVIIALIYLCVMLVKNFNYEYEYIFTNGDLDVDKIIAKKSRKRMISLSTRSITGFGKYDENTPQNNFKIIKADLNNGTVAYYADFTSTKFGNTRLIFSPEDKLFEMLKRYIPRSVYSFR